MRLYPNGSLAAHIMGGASFGKEGVAAAEVIGVAGVEKYFDDYLRDPANGATPLELSIDLTVQAASERILYGWHEVDERKRRDISSDGRAYGRSYFCCFIA